MYPCRIGRATVELATGWGTTTYTYDRENDVASITPPTGDPIRFGYYEHAYAAVKFPNQMTDAQHYDTDGRVGLIDQYFYDPDLPPGNYRDLAKQVLDCAGTDSLHSITDEGYDYSLECGYDAQGRISSSYGVSEGDIFEENSYSYDNNSNRTAWTLGSRGSTTEFTATYNGADHLTTVTRAGGPTTRYSYDQVGHLTGNSNGADTTCDARGRAAAVEHEHSNRGTLSVRVTSTLRVRSDATNKP